MYRLEVVHPGQIGPTTVRTAGRAGEVLDLVSELLSAHPNCERIDAWYGLTRLFAVDSHGDRIKA